MSENSNSGKCHQIEWSIEITAQNFKKMVKITQEIQKQHGWTNVKKIQTDCNYGFWKLVSLTVHFCERFEPRSHFKSRLSLIVRVNVVLNRTVFVDSDWRFVNLLGSHLQSQSELYHVSWWYYTLVIDLIGQLRRDVIGRLSVKPWCYLLWRLVISNWCVSIRLFSQLNSRLLFDIMLVTRRLWFSQLQVTSLQTWN